MPESLFFLPNLWWTLVTSEGTLIGTPKWKCTPKGTPAPEMMGNQTKPFEQLAAAAMWAGSHFYLIWSWALGETSVPFCWRILMNFITFPDLVQAEAAININEKSFQLRALLLWRLRLRWMGKCMCQNLFCIFLIMICHRRFWSWFNKPTAYICLLSLPPLSHLS